MIVFDSSKNITLASNHQEHSGKVLGYVGAPGIGKGYITRQLRVDHPELQFLWRLTTREGRDTDPKEGVRAITPAEFEQEREHIIAIHAPFKDRPITNGWYVNGTLDGLRRGESYITDPFVDLLHEFHDRFGDNMHLVGLVATPEYMQYNMQQRVLESKGGISQKDEDDIRMRTESGIEITEKVQSAARRGLLGAVIEVGFHNRDDLMGLVKKDLARNTNLYREGHRAPEGRAIALPEGYAPQYAMRK